MAEKTKRCTACGGDMHLRLGLYECAQCGLTEEVQAAPPPATHGPGLKRPQPWQSQGGGTSSGSGGTIYGQSGYGGPAPPPEHVPAFLRPPEGIYDSPEPRARSGGLDIEKQIYFGLQVAGAVLWVVAGAMLASVLGAGALLATIVIAVIAVAFSAFVLFSDALWIKYTCMGCLGLGVLSMLGSMVGILPAETTGQSAPITVLAQVLQLLLNLWLISILYRDAQRLQGN